MNGLQMLAFLFIGAVGGWCAHALLYITTRPYPPRPAQRDNGEMISDAEVRRIMRDWSK